MREKEARELLEICKKLDTIVDTELDSLWSKLQSGNYTTEYSAPWDCGPPHPDSDEYQDAHQLEVDAWELTCLIAKMRDRANKYLNKVTPGSLQELANILGDDGAVFVGDPETGTWEEVKKDEKDEQQKNTSLLSGQQD
jgi:hypothetical protein